MSLDSALVDNTAVAPKGQVSVSIVAEILVTTYFEKWLVTEESTVAIDKLLIL